MREILILNLTRMGDILQKTPLLLGLKERYPGVRVSVVVSNTFAEICKGIPFIDRVCAIDKPDLVKCLRDDRISLVEKVRRIQQFLEPLRKTEYDLVINLTHSRASAVLLYLLKAREIRGITINPEGHRCIRHPWMNYFFCAVTNRAYNSFNLVDMYLKAAELPLHKRGLVLEIPSEDEQFAKEFLRQRGLSEEDILIGLQPGASSENRCWPISSFARLADRLIDEMGCKVILFGSPGERGLGEGIIKAMKESPINAVGETTVMQLAALLKRCRVLVCPDTGPMHMATAVGTRVVALFLNTAFYPETGPYGEGHLVLHSNISCYPCDFSVECLHRICREDITADHVLQAVQTILDPTFPVKPLLAQGWERVGLLRSDFDADGFLNYAPVIKRPLTKRDLLREVYREVWKRGLGTETVMKSEAVTILDRLAQDYELDQFTTLTDPVQESLKTLERLQALAEEGIETTQALLSKIEQRPPRIEAIKTLSERLQAVDGKLELLGHTYEELRPLTTLFCFGRENIDGDGLMTLAWQSRRLYQDLYRWTISLSSLLRGVCSGVVEQGAGRC